MYTFLKSSETNIPSPTVLSNLDFSMDSQKFQPYEFRHFIVNDMYKAFNKKVHDKHNHIDKRKVIHVVLINKWHQPVILSKTTV